MEIFHCIGKAKFSAADVIKKFSHSIVKLYWNRPFWLDDSSHMRLFLTNQSALFQQSIAIPHNIVLRHCLEILFMLFHVYKSTPIVSIIICGFEPRSSGAGSDRGAHCVELFNRRRQKTLQLKLIFSKKKIW